MISITGTYQQGAVLLDKPVNLPEGAHVRVTLDIEESVARADEDLCMDGTPWPKTREEIERFIKEMDEIPGIEVSDEEYARIEAERVARKAEGIAETEERMERVSRLFE
jgi:predicted DNA-binding antitoxin AbrB/MazE fold protein